MARTGTSKRIVFFPKNPWPEGLGLDEFRWSGRLDAERGLFFDLHLRSESYHHLGVDDAEETDSDWESVNVWANYGSCILSSTKWGAHEGIHVADAEDPLGWNELDRWEFFVDTHTPVDDYEGRAFHIYLFGHGSVVRHRIHFAKAERGRFDLSWTAKFALTYGGSTNLSKSLRVEAKGIAFEGFQIPSGMSTASAKEALSRFVTDPSDYTLRKGRLWPRR